MSSKTFTQGRSLGPMAAAVMAGMLGGIPVFERQQVRVTSASGRGRTGWGSYWGGRGGSGSYIRSAWLARTANDAFQHVSTRGTRKPSRSQRKAMRLKAKGQDR